MIPTSFHNLRFISPSGNEYGGLVVEFDAGANLNFGDAVYVSAARTGNKSNVTADYAKFIGFVVGGDLLSGGVLQTLPSSGTVQVASNGKKVLIQISGIAPVILSGALTLSQIIIDNLGTAGRVANGTTAGQMLGTLVETGGAGDIGWALINHR